jgi:aspartate aminotransferase-like enzyme
MGNVDQNDIIATLSAIETSLKNLGYNIDLGSGLAAAEKRILST